MEAVSEVGDEKPPAQATPDLEGSCPATPSSALRRRPSASFVRDLPDLTERLKAIGIFGEYNTYRQRYLAWRQGSAKGATAELTAETLMGARDPYKFEFWYPTASIFKWRFTTAYWKAITFLIGSFCFTFNGALEYWGGPGGDALRNEPVAIGGVMFTVGSYFGYLQLINIATDQEDQVVYLCPDWKEVAKRITTPSSFVGTMAYFVGASIFNCGIVTAFFPDRSPLVTFLFMAIPNLIGGSLFVVGGVCELIHNRLFCGGAGIDEPAWWCSMANFLGGVHFFLGAVPGMLAPVWDMGGEKVADDFASLNYFLGSAFFIFGSALMVLMWESNDFGLTLLRQLNYALKANAGVNIVRPRTGGHVGLEIQMPVGRDTGAALGERTPLLGPQDATEEASSWYSMRGAEFIVIYSWCAFVAMINCIIDHDWYVHATVQHVLRHALDLAMQVFVVLVVWLVLCIHSAVADVPAEQPYQFVFVCSRIVLLGGTTVQTIFFVEYLLDPNYDEALARPRTLSIAGHYGTEMISSLLGTFTKSP